MSFRINQKQPKIILSLAAFGLSASDSFSLTSLILHSQFYSCQSRNGRTPWQIARRNSGLKYYCKIAAQIIDLTPSTSYQRRISWWEERVNKLFSPSNAIQQTLSKTLRFLWRWLSDLWGFKRHLLLLNLLCDDQSCRNGLVIDHHIYQWSMRRHTC